MLSLMHRVNEPLTLLVFVGIYLVIISEWSLLSHPLLWFWCIVLIGLMSVGITTHKNQ